MRTRFISACFLTLIAVLQFACASEAGTRADDNWPAWRGPLATGVAPNANPPTEWSETKNVKWKIKIPGEGTSTPVVWGDRIFILTAIGPEKQSAPPTAPTTAVAAGTNTNSSTGTNVAPDAGRPGRGGSGGGFGGPQQPTEKFQFVVLCIDRQTGKTLWQKTAAEEIPHEGHHQDHGYASASPVTDGEHVLAYFGSRGLHCYDMDGNLKWSKDFGHMITRNSFGEGASPALHGNTVVVYWDDQTENDFIVALDKRTGKELWKNARKEDTGWSTPLIVPFAGKDQVVVNATGKVRSYELASGQEIWSCGGQTGNPIPSPVADADTIYVMSGFRSAALFAIKLGSSGDLAGTEAIRWSYNKSTPYVSSPLLAGNSLYFLSGNKPELSCFDVKTGKPNFEAQRLEGLFNVYASPVSAADRVYVLSREGKCVVLKKDGPLEILATNKLDDKTDASMALVGRELFIRGRENLYCIAE